MSAVPLIATELVAVRSRISGQRPAVQRDRPSAHHRRIRAIARANAAFIESCVEATGELMTHLSAMDTAADCRAHPPGAVGYGLPYRLQNFLCDQRNELLFCYSLQLPKSCSHTENRMPL